MEGCREVVGWIEDRDDFVYAKTVNNMGYHMMEDEAALHILGMPPHHSLVAKPSEEAGSGYRSKSAYPQSLRASGFPLYPSCNDTFL